MIEKTYKLNHFTYERPFYGSSYGLKVRYRILGVMEELGARKKEPKELIAWIWKGPMAFEATPEEAKENQTFPFTEEGYDQLIAWLNDKASSIMEQED